MKKEKHGVLQVILEEPKISVESRDIALTAFKKIKQFRKAAALLWSIDHKAGFKINEMRLEARQRLTTTSAVTYRRVDNLDPSIVDSYTIKNPMLSVIADPISGYTNRLYGFNKVRMAVKKRRAEALTVPLIQPGTSNVEYIQNIICHRMESWFLGEQERKIFTTNKLPKEATPHIGIEIECYVPSREKLNSLLRPFARMLSIVGDGSIRPPLGQDAREIRILLKQADLHSTLPLIMQAVHEAGAAANDSCGLHVHFDMRDATPTVLQNRYERLFNAQTWLGKLVKSYRRYSTFCIKNVRSKFEDERSRGNRYTRINTQAYDKYQTLEIRLHHGTVNTEEIMSWITLLSSIQERADERTTPLDNANIDGFLEWAGVRDMPLAGYLKGRYELYTKEEARTLLRERTSQMNGDERDSLSESLRERARVEMRCFLDHYCPDSRSGRNQLLRVEHGLEDEETLVGIGINHTPVRNSYVDSLGQLIVVPIAPPVPVTQVAAQANDLDTCAACLDPIELCRCCEECEENPCECEVVDNEEEQSQVAV